MPAWESRSVHGRTVPLGCLLSLVEFFFSFVERRANMFFFGKNTCVFFGFMILSSSHV